MISVFRIFILFCFLGILVACGQGKSQSKLNTTPSQKTKEMNEQKSSNFQTKPTQTKTQQKSSKVQKFKLLDTGGIKKEFQVTKQNESKALRIVFKPLFHVRSLMSPLQNAHIYHLELKAYDKKNQEVKQYQDNRLNFQLYANFGELGLTNIHSLSESIPLSVVLFPRTPIVGSDTYSMWIPKVGQTPSLLKTQKFAIPQFSVGSETKIQNTVAYFKIFVRWVNQQSDQINRTEVIRIEASELGG